MSKLTDEERHAIYILKGCKSVSELAKRYKISESTIRNIQNPFKVEERKLKNQEYYQNHKDEFYKRVKDRRNYQYYGLEDVSDLKDKQIWEAETGERVLVLKGRGRLNIYDSKGNLRNNWKLIEKVCDITNILNLGEYI